MTTIIYNGLIPLTLNEEEGDNCGTGSGGFKPGNTCGGKGGGKGTGVDPGKDKMKTFVPKLLLAGLDEAGKPKGLVSRVLGLGPPTLSEKGKEETREAIHNVISSMPKLMLERIRENGLKKAVFHENAESTTKAWYRSGGQEYPGVNPGAVGFMDYRTGEVHSNGDDRSGVLAHELMHAVDGPGYILSTTGGWAKAFTEEIRKGMGESGWRPSLTKYATVNQHEGFAEFGRLVHGGHGYHSTVERMFPLCTKFFKDNGLWTVKEKHPPKWVKEKQWPERVQNSTGEGILPELFNHREEGPDGSHADCWVGEKAVTNANIENLIAANAGGMIYNAVMDLGRALTSDEETFLVNQYLSLLSLPIPDTYNNLVPLSLTDNFEHSVKGDDGMWRTIGGNPVYIKGGEFYPGGPGSKPVEKGGLFGKGGVFQFPKKFQDVQRHSPVPPPPVRPLAPSKRPTPGPLAAKTNLPDDPNKVRIEKGVAHVGGRPSPTFDPYKDNKEPFHEDTRSKQIREAGAAVVQKGKDILKGITESSLAKYATTAAANVRKVVGEVWDRAPAPLKATLALTSKMGLWMEDKMEHLHDAVQAFAKGIAHETAPEKVWKNAPGQLGKPQLLPTDANDRDDHADRIGRMLTTVDACTRWTANIPAAHYILRGLTGVGGPAVAVSAKLGYFFPVASVAFIGAKIAQATATGHNPFTLITNARDRAKEYIHRDELEARKTQPLKPPLAPGEKEGHGYGRARVLEAGTARGAPAEGYGHPGKPPSKVRIERIGPGTGKPKVLGGGTRNARTPSNRKRQRVDDEDTTTNGGPGSGNFGHPGYSHGQGGSGPTGKYVDKLESDYLQARKRADFHADRMMKKYGNDDKKDWPLEIQQKQKRLDKAVGDLVSEKAWAAYAWKDLKSMGYTKDTIQDLEDHHMYALKQDMLSRFAFDGPDDDKLTSSLNNVLDHYDYDPDNPVHNWNPDQIRDTIGRWASAAGEALGGAARAAGVVPKQDPPELHHTGMPSGRDIESAARIGHGGGSKPNFTVNHNGQQYFVKEVGSHWERVGNGKREVVGSEVSRLAGLEHPPVKSIVMGNKEYNISPMVADKDMAEHRLHGTLEREFARVPKAEVDKSVLADYAMGFGDTHVGNYLLGNGKITHIDKEYAFNTNPIVRNYKPSENHALLRLAVGQAPEEGLPRYDSNHGEASAVRQGYSFSQGEVRGMASRIPAMAQRLREHGMYDSATHLEHRGEVLHRLSQLSNPTVGDLERLHSEHGQATY